MAESELNVPCDGEHACKQSLMQRDFQADIPHVASDRYDKPIISDSLAIGMDQIAEHKTQFPDIEVTNEGQLVFDKYSTHQAYLTKTGHIKHPGKLRKRVEKKVATATATE
jgi:hypothetical protein